MINLAAPPNLLNVERSPSFPTAVARTDDAAGGSAADRIRHSATSAHESARAGIPCRV